MLRSAIYKRSGMIAVLLVIFNVILYVSIAQSQDASAEDISIATWNDFSISIGSDERLPIKVGRTYLFEEVTVARNIGWSLEWVIDPVEARARTRLFTYELGVALEEWDELRAELEHKPGVKIVLLEYRSGSEKAYGVPIKWNEGFADLMSNARAEDLRLNFEYETVLPNAVAAQSMAAGLYLYTAYWSQLQNANGGVTIELPSAAIEMLAMSEVGAKSLSAAIVNDAAIKGLSDRRFLIGIDYQPEALTNAGLTPNSRIITYSGAFGEKLGREVPKWTYEPCQLIAGGNCGN